MTIKQNIFYIILLSTLFAAQGVFAETVIITNVSSSANSGGNSASGGQVVEGDATAEVFMETIINGEVVQSLHKKETSQSGSVFLEESFVYESDDVVIENSASAQTHMEGTIEKTVSQHNEDTNDLFLVTEVKEEFMFIEDVEEIAEVEEVEEIAEVEEVEKVALLRAETKETKEKGLLISIKNFFTYVFSIFT